METLKHMRTRQGAPATGTWGCRCGAAGQPQPAGEHGAPRGALRCVIHEAVGSAVKKVTVLVEICALIYFLFVCMFVCLKQVPTSLRKPCPTFPRNHGGVFFPPLVALHNSSFLFFVFRSFFPVFLFLSFLPLFLSLSCARAFKKTLSLFF